MAVPAFSQVSAEALARGPDRSMDILPDRPGPRLGGLGLGLYEYLWVSAEFLSLTVAPCQLGLLA